MRLMVTLKKYMRLSDGYSPVTNLATLYLFGLLLVLGLTMLGILMTNLTVPTGLEAVLLIVIIVASMLLSSFVVEVLGKLLNLKNRVK